MVQYNAGAWGVAERYQYDPDGNVTYWTTGWQPETTRATNNTILFAGCELDGVTGLYYMRARYYDPALNRFISRDPLGYAGSPINLYEYCGDNPVDSVDPSGLCTLISVTDSSGGNSGGSGGEYSLLTVQTGGGGSGGSGGSRGGSSVAERESGVSNSDSNGDVYGIVGDETDGRAGGYGGGYVLTADEVWGGNSSDEGAVIIFAEGDEGGFVEVPLGPGPEVLVAPTPYAVLQLGDYAAKSPSPTGAVPTQPGRTVAAGIPEPAIPCGRLGRSIFRGCSRLPT